MSFLSDYASTYLSICMYQQNVSDMAVLHILSQDRYQQPSDLIKSRSVYQYHGERKASGMDVCELSVVRVESPQKNCLARISIHSLNGRNSLLG